MHLKRLRLTFSTKRYQYSTNNYWIISQIYNFFFKKKTNFFNPIFFYLHQIASNKKTKSNIRKVLVYSNHLLVSLNSWTYIQNKKVQRNKDILFDQE